MCIGVHPFIPAPNTARVRMTYSQLGQTLENVFYFTQTGPFTTAQLTTLAASVATEWNSNIKSFQSNTATLVAIEATALDTSAGAQIIHPVGTVGGDSSTAPAPTSVTLAIKFSSGLSGRSQRGRMYYIGSTVGNLAGDQYSGGVAAGILAAYNTFFTNVEATSLSTHAIVSYCHLGAWRTTAQVTHVISRSLTDNNVDSQRRRLAGRGI